MEGFRLLNWTDDQLDGFCEEGDDSRIDDEGNCVRNGEENFESKQYAISANINLGQWLLEACKELCCLKPD